MQKPRLSGFRNLELTKQPLARYLGIKQQKTLIIMISEAVAPAATDVPEI